MGSSLKPFLKHSLCWLRCSYQSCKSSQQLRLSGSSSGDGDSKLLCKTNTRTEGKNTRCIEEEARASELSHTFHVAGCQRHTHRSPDLKWPIAAAGGDDKPQETLLSSHCLSLLSLIQPGDKRVQCVSLPRFNTRSDPKSRLLDVRRREDLDRQGGVQQAQHC